MSDILFMGQEVADFNSFGSTGTYGIAGDAYHRTAVLTESQSILFQNRYEAPLVEPIGVTEVFYTQYLNTVVFFGPDDGSTPFAYFAQDDQPVFGFGIKNSTSDARLTLIAYSGGVGSIVATAASQSYVGAAKLDFAIDLASGRVRMWCDGVPMLDQVVNAGLLRTGNPNKLVLTTPSYTGRGYAAFHWGCVVARFDLRGCRLTTLVPNADTATKQWTGSFTDVADLDYRTSATAIVATTPGQESVMDLTNLPAGNFVIRGAKLTGVFSRGTDGPNSVAMGIDIGAGVSYQPAATVDEGPTWVRNYLETAPDGTPFTLDQINAMKIAVKSGS